MARVTRSNTLKKRMIEAMDKNLGVVTLACRATGIARKTFYAWYNTDKEFKEACDAVNDVALDYAESQLFKCIKDGSVASIIFYLKTKGKKRGYVERQEIMGPDGEPVQFVFSTALLDDDEIEAMNEEKEPLQLED